MVTFKYIFHNLKFEKECSVVATDIYAKQKIF